MLNFPSIFKGATRNQFQILKHMNTVNKKRVIAHLDEDVIKGVEEDTMSMKKHPGRMKPGLTVFDDDMLDRIKVTLGDTSIKSLLKDARIFTEYLKGRCPPVTKDDYFDKRQSAMNEMLQKMKIDPASMNDEELESKEKLFSKRVNTLLKQRIYNWAPITYTTYMGKQYIMSRMAPEYAALNKIFFEIVRYCPDFKPYSLLDVGSGVGTVTWAAKKYWENSLKEFYNVDASVEMHELAESLQKGREADELRSPYVFYRQFLPVKIDRKYDLVVCSYSLFDFPSRELRLETMLKLWNKTDKFLVIVERGNIHGFKLINEVRSFILDTEKYAQESQGIHVFAPCPHESDCPQVDFTEKPCCFRAHYIPPPIGRRTTIQREYFSYVVFRKGKRPDNDKQWPRVLRPVHRRKRTATLHLCTKDCKLRVIKFTKQKHGQTPYQIGRCVSDGDKLPMSFTEVDLDIFNEPDVHDIVSENELPDYDDDDSDIREV